MSRARCAVLAICLWRCAVSPILAQSTDASQASSAASNQFAGLAQSPEANLFTGTFGVGIPIDIPPGRKNATPKLTLGYSSAGGPSPFGHGWDVALGRIQRSTKWGVPRCDGPHVDDFVLVMPSGTTELVAVGSNRYRPHIETSFIEAVRDTAGNSWTVHDRSGIRYTFGAQPGSRIGSNSAVFLDVVSCTFTTAWGLTRIEDNNGNTVDISYRPESTADNVLYPASIDYGGRSAGSPSHFYHVEFSTWEMIPDGQEIRSNALGAESIIRMRAKTIDVTTDVPQADTLIRRYTLTYDVAPMGQAGMHSILTGVSATGRPDQFFVYEEGTRGFLATPQSYAPPPGVDSPLQGHSGGDTTQTTTATMDLNGDGYLDIVRAGSFWSVHLGSSSGPATGAQQWQVGALASTGLRREVVSGDWSNVHFATFDITGDGVPDFVDATDTPWLVYKGVRYNVPPYIGGFAGAIEWPAPSIYIRRDFVDRDGPEVATRTTKQETVDMNADGLADLVNASNPTWMVYMNTGAGFEANPRPFVAAGADVRLEDTQYHPGGAPRHSGFKHDLLDFNGDGLPDRVAQRSGAECGDGQIVVAGETKEYVYSCLDAFLNTGQGFMPTPLTSRVPVSLNFLRESRAVGSGPDQVSKNELMDVNADGLPDLVCWGSDCNGSSESSGAWYVQLNQGGHLEEPRAELFGNQFVALAPRAWPNTIGPIRKTHRAGSSTTFTTPIDIADWNGDGMVDKIDSHGATWNIHLSGAAARTNLLTRMRNQLGGITDLVYTPSTRFSNTGGDSIADLPIVTWVGTRMRETDALCTPPANIDVFERTQNPCIDAGHERITEITYQDGRFDPEDREMRGFGRVDRRDVDGNVRSTTFNQDNLRKGTVQQVDIFAGNTQVVQRDKNTWTALSAGDGRHQLYLEKSRSDLYDLNPSPQGSLCTYNDPPDAAGNILHTCRDNCAGSACAGLPRVDNFLEFAAPIGASQVRDRPSHTYSVYRDQAGTPQRFDEKWFTYDGTGQDGLPLGQVEKGNLRMVESWLDSGPANPKVRSSYDSFGNIVSVTDALGRTTVTSYDDGSGKSLFPYAVTNHRGHQVVTQTDYRFGVPKRVTDPNGAISEFAYDALGRPTCIAKPGDSLNNCSEKFAYFFGSTMTLSRVEVSRREPSHPSGYVTTKSYQDALGRLRHRAAFRVVNGSDQTVIVDRTEYDAAGRPARRYEAYPTTPPMPADTAVTTGALNGMVSFDYHFNGGVLFDPLGRVWRVTNADGTTVRTEYAGFATTVYDPENHKQRSLRDFLGRTVLTETYTGNGTSVPYALYSSLLSKHDGGGMLLETIQNGNDATRVVHTYDSLGRKLSSTDPDSGTWTYRYDLAGNLTIQQDPKANQHVQLCYDELNRVSKKLVVANDSLTPVSCSMVDESTVTYEYDTGAYGLGRLRTVSDPSGTTVFTYDHRGRTTAEQKTIVVDGVSRTATTSFFYDAADRAYRVGYPDCEFVTTGFDRSGQPTMLSGTVTYVSSVLYDVFGRATQIVHGTGTGSVTDSREYYGLPGDVLLAGKAHRLKRAATSGPGGAYVDLSYSSYTPRGFLQQITDNRNATGVLSNKATFVYDDVGRLSAVTSSPNMAGTWVYDTLGNMTQKADVSPALTFTYSATRPHTLTQINGSGAGIAHDDNGNRLGKAGHSYDFDADDRLTAVSNLGVEFQYDYSGRRVASTYGGTVTRYYNRLLEVTGGNLTKWYFMGNMRVASSQRPAPPTMVSLNPDAPVQVAGGSFRPMLLVQLRPDVAQLLATLLMFTGIGLLVLPYGRRRAMGMVVRHGQVVLILGVFTATAMPIPIVVRAAGAGGGGGGGAGGCTVGTIRHYHYDHLGSTQAVTDSAGNLIEQVRYRAYGEVRGRYNPQGTVLSNVDQAYRYEFTGYHTDLPSGLEYAGARWYDPALGMFLTHDPADQFANPYAYGPWNPINGTDPDGAFFETLIPLLLELVPVFAAGFAVGTLQAELNGADPNGQSVTAGAIGGATAVAGYVGFGIIQASLTGMKMELETFHFLALASGVYGTAEGFRTGQYLGASLGALSLAGGIISSFTSPQEEPTAGSTQEDWEQLYGAELEPASSEGEEFRDPDTGLYNGAAEGQGLGPGEYVIPGGGQAKVGKSAVVQIGRSVVGRGMGAAVRAQPARIYSGRELIRRAAESGPYHNFPKSFDAEIFEHGTRIVTPDFYKVAKSGLGSDAITYRLQGSINGKSGAFEIGVRPSSSGRTEVIMHRFFRPDP